MAASLALLFILLQKWGRSMQRHFKTAFLTGSRFLNEALMQGLRGCKRSSPPCSTGAPTPHPCYPCHLHPWLPQAQRQPGSSLTTSSVGHGDRTSRSGSGWPPSHSMALLGLPLWILLGLLASACWPSLQPWGPLLPHPCPLSGCHTGSPVAPLSTDLPWFPSLDQLLIQHLTLRDLCAPNCVPPRFIYRPNPQGDCIWRQEGNGSYIRS